MERDITSSPFLGRESELEEMRKHLKKCTEGIGGLVFIVGEAGSGKSRFLDEIRWEAEEQGCSR